MLDATHLLDLIAVVEHVASTASVTVKSGANAGKQIPKRNITLVDSSERTVELTLWDENIHKVAEEQAASHSVVAIKNVRVSDYGGRSLSTSRDTHIELNPDLPEANTLRGW